MCTAMNEILSNQLQEQGDYFAHSPNMDVLIIISFFDFKACTCIREMMLRLIEKVNSVKMCGDSIISIRN